MIKQINVTKLFNSIIIVNVKKFLNRFATMDDGGIIYS